MSFDVSKNTFHWPLRPFPDHGSWLLHLLYRFIVLWRSCALLLSFFGQISCMSWPNSPKLLIGGRDHCNIWSNSLDWGRETWLTPNDNPESLVHWAVSGNFPTKRCRHQRIVFLTVWVEGAYIAPTNTWAKPPTRVVCSIPVIPVVNEQNVSRSAPFVNRLAMIGTGKLVCTCNGFGPKRITAATHVYDQRLVRFALGSLSQPLEASWLLWEAPRSGKLHGALCNFLAEFGPHIYVSQWDTLS